MKIFSVKITFLFLLCTLLSCEKFLEVEPVDRFDKQFVFNSLVTANMAVMGVYDPLNDNSGYGSRLSLILPYNSDEAIGAGGSPNDNGLGALSSYDVNATNTQMVMVFNELYKGIERANVCISNIPKMRLYNQGNDNEKAQLRRYHGEALALRAIYYHNLIKHWGEVPAQFLPSSEMPNLFIEKSDRNVIYAQILEDLKTAAELVPWLGENGAVTGERLTKGAIKGFRARIALARGGYSLRKGNVIQRDADYKDFYEIAKDECFDVIQRSEASNTHGLNANYAQIFKNITSSVVESKEVLFEVAMLKGLESKIGWYDGPQFYLNGGTTLKGNASVRVAPTYFYAFDSLDVRRDVTIALYNVNLQTGMKKIPAAAAGALTMGKFRADWVMPMITVDLDYLGSNFPMLRYSDILLMFAEAEFEINGATVLAKKYIKEVRKRAFPQSLWTEKVDNYVDNTLGADFFEKLIVNERFLEFGGEAIRKYDLIRWNKLASRLDYTNVEVEKMRKIASVTHPLYATYARYIFYKESVDIMANIANSFYKTGPTATNPQIPGYTRVNWMYGVGTMFKDRMKDFVPNQSELMPLPIAAIEANYKLKQDFGKY